MSEQKPKYVYLDKFERYKLSTNRFMESLEEEQNKIHVLLYQEKIKIKKSIKKLYFLSIIFILLHLFFLLTIYLSVNL
jgi:ATP-dependent helicase/DNAse subunit B